MCDRIKARAPPPCQSTTNARTELAEVLDRLDVGAEEALHLRVHHLDCHLVWSSILLENRDTHVISIFELEPVHVASHTRPITHNGSAH